MLHNFENDMSGKCPRKSGHSSWLPSSSVSAFIEGFTTGSFLDVPGLTQSILAAGTQAYRTVFYLTISFTGVGSYLELFRA